MLNCHGLKMLYYAQFFSHLSYCIVMLGSMLTFEKKEKLKMMQNCCVKLLDRSKCLNEIYRKHKILKFDDLVNLEQNKLGYKLNNNLLPSNLANILLTDRIGKTLKKNNIDIVLDKKKIQICQIIVVNCTRIVSWFNQSKTTTT